MRRKPGAELLSSLRSGNTETRLGALEEAVENGCATLHGEDGTLSFSDIFSVMTGIVVSETAKSIPNDYLFRLVEVDSLNSRGRKHGTFIRAPETRSARAAVEAAAKWVARFAVEDEDGFFDGFDEMNATAWKISEAAASKYIPGILGAMSMKHVESVSGKFVRPPIPLGAPFVWSKRAVIHLVARSELVATLDYEGNRVSPSFFFDEMMKEDETDWGRFFSSFETLGYKETTLKHGPFPEAFYSPFIVRAFSASSSDDVFDKAGMNKVQRLSCRYGTDFLIADGENVPSNFAHFVDAMERCESGVRREFSEDAVKRFSRLVDATRNSGMSSEFFSSPEGERLLRAAARMRREVETESAVILKVSDTNPETGKGRVLEISSGDFGVPPIPDVLHVPGMFSGEILLEKDNLERFFGWVPWFDHSMFFPAVDVESYSRERRILHEERLFVASNAGVWDEKGPFAEIRGRVVLSPRTALFLAKLWGWGPSVSECDPAAYRYAAVKALVSAARVFDCGGRGVDVVGAVRASLEEVFPERASILGACRDIAENMVPETLAKLRAAHEKMATCTNGRVSPETRMSSIAEAWRAFSAIANTSDSRCGDERKQVEEYEDIFLKFGESAAERYGEAVPEDRTGFRDFLASVDVFLRGNDLFAASRRAIFEGGPDEKRDFSEEDFRMEFARSSALDPLLFEGLEEIFDEISDGDGRGGSGPVFFGR